MASRKGDGRVCPFSSASSLVPVFVEVGDKGTFANLLLPIDPPFSSPFTMLLGNFLSKPSPIVFACGVGMSAGEARCRVDAMRGDACDGAGDPSTDRIDADAAAAR